MTSSTFSVRPSSRSTRVSPRWSATVAAAVAVVVEAAGAVAAVVAAAEVVAGAAATAPLLVTAAGRQSRPVTLYSTDSSHLLIGMMHAPRR